jgi:hypothetical protein
VDYVRNLISIIKTRNIKEFDITGIRIIYFGDLRPINNLNNNSDEEEIKKDINSADYSIGV